MKIKRGLPFGRPLQFKSLARVHITLVKMMHGRYQKSFILFPVAKPFCSIYSFFALASLLQEAVDFPEQQDAFFPASAVFPAQHPASLLPQEAFFPSAPFGNNKISSPRVDAQRFFFFCLCNAVN